MSADLSDVFLFRVYPRVSAAQKPGVFMTIDLNCDMGESFGRYTLGCDADVMPLISSANIACGFHAGDPVVMQKTVQLAAEHGTGMGAHPAFPDLSGFGRRYLRMSAAELRNAIIYQLGALQGFTQMAGRPFRHVKPHGALYTMAACDDAMSQTIVDAVAAFDDTLIVFGLSGSRFADIARKAGLAVASEAFADRAYADDGTLVAREQPGAVITDSTAIVERVLQMVEARTVASVTGVTIPLDIDTICVHGDTPGAVEHVRRIAEALHQAGIPIRPVEK